MYFARPTPIRVTHMSHEQNPDDDFDVSNLMMRFTIQGLVERLQSGENTLQGAGYASSNAVKVHVSDPQECNVQVGDTFKYGSNTYKVTAVDDGIMIPVFGNDYRWSFRGETLVGSD